MIKLKINNEVYTINNDLSVSNGKHKSFIETCVATFQFEYKVWKGFFEPHLYTRLSEVKMIELISCDFVPPKNNENIFY